MEVRTIIVIALFVLGYHLTSFSQITEAEYFFDNDPGAGNGNSLVVTFGNTVDETFSISTTELDSGLHVLHLRVKGTDDVWSLFNRSYFFVQHINNIVPKPIDEVEYFFDTDPGVGNASSLVVTNGYILDEILNIQVPENLINGNHYLHIRAKDMDGNWSLYRWALLEIDATLTTENFNLSNVLVFPNPTSSHIEISSPVDIESVVLYDSFGRRIFLKNELENNRLSVNHLESGIYLMNIKFLTETLIKKIIIE